MASIKNPGFAGPALSRAVLLCALLAPGAPALAAPPVKLGLVVGETAYAGLPPLPACAGSANLVASALERRGFAVTKKLDTTNGETGAALAGFAKALAGAPGATAVLYFCGYAAAFDTRSFLLPVSANIERPSDLLTQGVVARSTLTAIAPATGGGLLALDAFAQPGSSTPPRLELLTQGSALPNVGYVAAAEANASEAPTPLAAALAAGFSGETVATATLLRDLQQRLSATPQSKLLAVQPPASTSFLAGGPPPEQPSANKEAPVQAPPPTQPPPAPPAPAAAPAAPATPPPATSSAALPQPAAPQAIPAMPPENLMSESDRRRVQTALAQLGYYDGRVDGQFGPETRAAIRRFQHEIGADMTGRLTPEQAGRLVAGRG